MENSVRIPTPNENINWYLVGTEDDLRVWKEQKSSTGEIATGHGQTTETITIVRNFAGNFSEL